MSDKNTIITQFLTRQENTDKNDPDLSALQCCKCKQKPVEQFTILICDHIICGDCLNPNDELSIQYTESQAEQAMNHEPEKYRHCKDKQTFGAEEYLNKIGKKLKLSAGYEGIRCPCGAITYFKNDGNFDEKMCNKEHQNIYDIHPRTTLRGQRREHRQYYSRRNSTRPSTGLIYSRNTSPNFVNNESYDTRIRVQTEPMEQKSFSEISHYQRANPRFSKEIKPRNPQKDSSPRMSFKSPTTQNMSMKRSSLKKQINLIKPKTKFNQEMMEQSLYSIESPYAHSYRPNYSLEQSYLTTPENETSFSSPFYEQLKTQLEHLQNQYDYHMNTLNKYYQKIVSALNAKFLKLEETIKDLSLTNIVMGQKSNIDLSQLIGSRYEDDILRHIETLTQYLDQYYKLRYQDAPFLTHVSQKNTQESIPLKNMCHSFCSQSNKRHSEKDCSCGKDFKALERNCRRREQNLTKQNNMNEYNKERPQEYCSNPTINIYNREKTGKFSKLCSCCNREQPHQCPTHGIPSRKLQKKSKARRNVIIEL